MPQCKHLVGRDQHRCMRRTVSSDSPFCYQHDPDFYAAWKQAASPKKPEPTTKNELFFESLHYRSLSEKLATENSKLADQVSRLQHNNDLLAVALASLLPKSDALQILLDEVRGEISSRGLAILNKPDKLQ